MRASEQDLHLRSVPATEPPRYIGGREGYVKRWNRLKMLKYSTGNTADRIAAIGKAVDKLHYTYHRGVNIHERDKKILMEKFTAQLGVDEINHGIVALLKHTEHTSPAEGFNRYMRQITHHMRRVDGASIYDAEARILWQRRMNAAVVVRYKQLEIEGSIP